MDCTWSGKANSEEELLKMAGQHAKEVHKMEPTPEMVQQIRSLIHDE